MRPASTTCRPLIDGIIVLALATLAAVVLHVPAAWSGPQPHTPAGGDVGKDYVLAALERILPDEWMIAEYREGTVPRQWDGASEALEVKIEDQSITLHHPAGFDYHPFIRLTFCPSPWTGSMQETDLYGSKQPAFLLGKNHIFRVFYQPRGLIRWDGVYEQLAVTFDLTRPRVDQQLRQELDLALRSRLAHRMASVIHDLRNDVLDRLVGLDRQGSLLYVEYVATIAAPPAEAGSSPLPGSIRSIVDEETEGLAEQIFQAIPEVTTIYLRRLCDNRMFDSLFDRATLSATNRAGTPATAGRLD
jgi:hypothetical protein